MKYDLEERTSKFAESIVGLAGKVAKNAITLPIISQIVRAGTSVGANYCEANAASSKNDFRNKIYICRKEIQETKYWLELLAAAGPEQYKKELRLIWKEAHELTLIFNKISQSLKRSLKIGN